MSRASRRSRASAKCYSAVAARFDMSSNRALNADISACCFSRAPEASPTSRVQSSSAAASAGFDPGARIGEQALALGCGERKPRVFIRYGDEFLLQAIGSGAVLVLLLVGVLYRRNCRPLSRRRKLLLQQFDARVLLGKRPLPCAELLRQKRILGGEALGTLLQDLGVRSGLQFLQSLFGRARRAVGALGRRPGGWCRRAGRRLTFPASDVGAG